MNHRRYYSLGLFILMMGTTFFGLITMDAFQTSVTKEEDTNTENEVINKGLPKNILPTAAAYYKTFTFQTRNSFTPAGGYTNYFIMDMAEDNTYNYYSGYTLNATNNRSLFLMRANKATPGVKANEIYYQEYENETVGLCIGVDSVNSRVYVGGYYGLNTTASPTFETAEIAMVWCYSLNFATQYWKKIITGNDGGVSWGRTKIEGQNDIGGQRIEDLVVLPDGNVTVTGAKFDYTNKGDFLYIETIDGDDGTHIGEYLASETPTPVGAYPWFSSVGKRIILDSYYQRLITIGLRKYEYTGDSGEDFLWYNYVVFTYLNGTKILDMMLDDFRAVLWTSAGSYRETNYPQLNDLWVSKTGDLWACGTNRSSYHKVDNQVVFQLDTTTGFPSFTNHFPKFNQTAEFMSIDVNGTLHLAGLVMNNATGQSGLLVKNYDMARNMFEINRTTYFYPSYRSILKAAIWNNVTREWTLAGYQTSAAVQGFLQKCVTSTYLPTETLTPIGTYTHSRQVQLTWTQLHPELRYYRIYREEVALTVGNIGGFSARTTINISAQGTTASYLDTLPDIEGIEYCYALVCTSDNITNPIALSTSNTTLYYAPEKPAPTFNPTWVSINKNVTISNFQVPNAGIEIYQSRTSFTKDDLATMTPKFKGLVNNSVIVNLNALGAWYYMINAYNTTVRGNTTSDLITIWCQDPAISPSTISITLFSSDDGNLRITWDKVDMANYLVYAMANYSFTIATQRSSLTLKGNKTTNLCEITDCASGNWYFGVLGYNSSGEAVSFSQIKNQTIKRTPLQPELRSPKGDASIDGKISLEWDNVSLATTYKLYRRDKVADKNDVIDVDNFQYATLVYSGKGLTYSDVLTENGLYVYIVIAENVNGHRVIDKDLCVVISVNINSKASIDSSLLYGLIGGAVIIGVVVTIVAVYKKRNPYF